MRKASTRTLEQGIQAPSPAPDLIPAEISTENLHWDWYNERGHVTGIRAFRLSMLGLAIHFLGVSDWYSDI
jgi:hypothetical protein